METPKERKIKEKGIEEMFEVITAENLLKLMTGTKPLLTRSSENTA